MIIGLSGFAGVGKDTLGAEFVRRGFTRLSFAEPLKELALRCDPIVEFETSGVFTRLAGAVEARGWESAKFDVYDVRRFLQALGVGAREIFGEDFWVNQLRDRVNFDPISGIVGNYVVTDVRFPNEAKMIKGFGQGYMVEIYRPGVGPVNEHASEKPLPRELIDTHVNNFGGLSEIPTIVDWILSDVEWIKMERAKAARNQAARDTAKLQAERAALHQVHLYSTEEMIAKSRKAALAEGFQEIGQTDDGLPVFMKPIEEEGDK